MPLSSLDSEDCKINICNEASEIDMEDTRSTSVRFADKTHRVSISNKENDKERLAYMNDITDLRVTELEHHIIMLQRRHKAKIKDLEEEIRRLQAQIVEADSTEDATGDPSTTILHLKAKLKRAEEQRTADQAALQRMQQMLTSTQDNANLANSCLLKKVHAAQQATEAAHKTAALSEQQRKADASASQQVLEEKCASMQERIDKALVLTDKLEGKLAAYRLGQPVTAAKVAESEVYEPTAVHNPTDAYDPAAKGLQSVPAQSQQVQSTSSAHTVWLTAAQGHDSLDAQLGVQRQQHDLELATVHRQFAQQLAQIQQDHLHQLAAHSAQQPLQETRKQTGLLKQLFGSLPDRSLQLNPIEPSRFKLALVEQQREALQAITEAQQLKYAGQLHEVQAQLAAAQQQFAHKVQELEQCQQALGSTEALHVQHILSMADLEQQLQAEKGTSSAQSQQLHHLQERLVAADAHSSQTSADMTALNVQLSDASKIAHSQEQLLQQLQSRAADAEAAEAQTASSMIALKQQLASKDRSCAFQEQQLSRLTHKLAATQDVDRIITLRGKLTAAEQAAKSQQALFSSYKVQHADQQRQLDQIVTASQAQEVQAKSTITALQQQVCELSKASQQQVNALEQETASQMQTLQEAECQLAAAQQSIKEQLRAVQQQCDRQLSEQQARHSTHIRALQAQHDSAVAALRQQVASSTGSQLAADDSSSIPMNIHLELMYKKVQQKVLAADVKHAALTATQQQKVAAANAKQAALTADLQQQLQAKTLLVTRLQKELAEQTRAAAAYKTALEDSRGHAANLKTDYVLANRASDLSNKASKAQCMLLKIQNNVEVRTVAKLTAELQAQKQQTQWLQDSFDSIATSEAFYKEREKKVAHLTYDGRMMAAELEMLWDRTQPSAADPMSTTPLEQLASVLQELEALRAKVYPDVYPIEDDAQQLSDSEDDWGIDDY